MLEEEAVQIDSVELQPVSTVVTIPTTPRRLSDDTAPSCSNTITLVAPGCTSYTDDTIYQSYPRKQKYGPLHAFAIWCMQQSCFDDLLFFLIFCVCAFIYLPLPADNPAMPFFRLFLYSSMTVLIYSMACRLPARWRLVFHPIIVTSAGVMAGIAYFESIKGINIHQGVNHYKTGITFISLVEKTNVGWPGAGDIFAATMDVAIISMAFNVYKNRPDSFRHVSCFLIYFLIYITHFCLIYHSGYLYFVP